MAEPLTNQYRIEVAVKIAAMIYHVFPTFDRKGFVSYVEEGYEALKLMDRGKKIAQALKLFLPDNYPDALTCLIASLDSPLELDPKNSIASFIFMPHSQFVAENGLEHFDLSMDALYNFTQRFSAEFAIRPFIQRYPEKTLVLLHKWALDPNTDVRRLVSEGTRPRLPWASRLPEFIHNPSPVIALLELLKDDPELYVRRSVANNLNDIGKDHPELLAETAKRWLENASAERQWLVKHALRSAIKRGELGALEALGCAKPAKLSIENISLAPQIASMGDSIEIGFELTNRDIYKAVLMVDFCIYFIKANGQPSPKVFKLKALELEPNQSQGFKKKVSLKPMTTRTLYSGIHKVELIVNGIHSSLGEFELSAN